MLAARLLVAKCWQRSCCEMLLSLPVTLEAICETSDHETARGDCWKQNCWRRGCWRRDTGGEAARPTATLTMRLLAPAMSWPTVPRVSIASHNESGQLPKILGKNVTTKLMF